MSMIIDDNADTGAVVGRQFETALAQGLAGSGNGILCEGVRAAGLLGAHVVRYVEPLELPGYLRRQAGGIVTGHRADAASALRQPVPEARDIETEGSDSPHSGNDSLSRHVSSSRMSADVPFCR
jgi:hypothetical protein